MAAFRPAYLNLLAAGELEKRVAEARLHLFACDMCGWKCSKDRLNGQLGVCRTGSVARVSSYGPHHGEENVLRGWRGSGTIFFTRCNLRCQFCQNHDISQTDNGKLMEAEAIAGVMLELQALGCHNINLVSPTHVVPPILAAVWIAAQAGLRLPLVYNTGGYDSLEALRLLDGVVDIYMPDMKYANPNVALHYSKVHRYPEVNQTGVREMFRQVGNLQIDEHGLAQRGLLVRHLILPNGVAGTEQILRFLADEISTDTYINLMDQYHPAFQAHYYHRIDRPIKNEEFSTAVSEARRLGLYRLDQL
jgi:putative pyruvate formate lyase activating enzyme